MLLSTTATSDSKVLLLAPQTISRLNNFFQGLSFEARYLVLEFVSDDLHALLRVSKKWRAQIRELLVTTGMEAAKKFVARNKDFVRQYDLDLRVLKLERASRVDLLLNLKFNEVLKAKRVAIDYSYRLLGSSETRYCTFEFNLTDAPQNRLYVFYEHARLEDRNSALWSSVNHNYSFLSTISLPLIVNSGGEFVDIRSVKWQRARVGALRTEAEYETGMVKNFNKFQWKAIKNQFLEQLLPTELLQANFALRSQSYYGMDTVVLKAEYAAVKKGRIMIVDETDSKNVLKINIYDNKERGKLTNIMKPVDIVKDVEETLNLCENDVVVFYVKKTFDNY